jgi:LEA14-like dessication related protein
LNGQSAGIMKNILLWIAAGLGAYWLYSKYVFVNGLTFVPRGIESNLTGIQVTVGVQNATDTSQTLTSFSGTLYINGSGVGNVSMFAPVNILPNAETPLPFAVTPSEIGIANEVISALQNGVDGLSAVLKGTANFGGNAVPLNISF